MAESWGVRTFCTCLNAHLFCVCLLRFADLSPSFQHLWMASGLFFYLFIFYSQPLILQYYFVRRCILLILFLSICCLFVAASLLSITSKRFRMPVSLTRVCGPFSTRPVWPWRPRWWHHLCSNLPGLHPPAVREDAHEECPHAAGPGGHEQSEGESNENSVCVCVCVCVLTVTVSGLDTRMDGWVALMQPKLSSYSCIFKVSAATQPQGKNSPPSLCAMYYPQITAPSPQFIGF